MFIDWKPLMLLAITSASFFLAPAQAAKPQEKASKEKAQPKTSPPEVRPAAVARGQKIFEKLTCAGCHPAGGNTLHPYRPLKGPGFLARYQEDRQIEQLIRSGVARAGMPAFGKAQLNDKEMSDLIAFIRSLTPNLKKQ